MAERLYIQNRKRREKRKEQLRLIGKLALIILGCAFLLLLIFRTVGKLIKSERKEETGYVTLQEAGNLIWLLADTAAQEESAGTGESEIQPDADAILEALKKMAASAGDGYLIWEQVEWLLDFLPACKADFPGAYRKKEKVSASDWYAWFDEARAVYDRQGRIQDIALTVMGIGENVKTNDGTALTEQQLVTTERSWNFFAERFASREVLFRTVTAIGREDGLYAVRSIAKEEGFTLSNVWVNQADEEGVLCFWNDYEIRFPLYEELDASKNFEIRDQIADIAFYQAGIKRIQVKNHKVSGRLLRIADGGAEIEGQGFFPFSDNLKIYQLYGRMKRLYTTDLCIGYAFTDFVIEDGKIEAALVPKEEKMEYIRVLVKTSNYGSAYHDQLEVQADCDCTIIAGTYGSRTQTTLAAGKTIEISADSGLFAEGNRIWIRPDILTGHISLLNVERSQGVPSYRGSFELIASQDGIVAINEVLLEEYLYAVVPSEMPASYPLEALKSQAVCARTYAYAKMRHAGLPSYGAHVDDSAGFQVYQNIEENSETTKAVKETNGEVLFYEGELAEVYYYSTSCGYGADASVWLNGSAEKYPYLVSQKIGTQDSFYEQEEPWFCWQYEVSSLDEDTVNLAILKRYEANPEGVLTKQSDGSFLSQKPSETGHIRDISVVRYGPGGVAEELEIEGEKATILVKTEHNIRYVLCDGRAQVVRQDESLVSAASMVPSAFFTIDTFKENGFVVGYCLSGGGFGHGVGLSQNGAKNMAAAGIAADDILSFFYSGCERRNVYEWKETLG